MPKAAQHLGRSLTLGFAALLAAGAAGAAGPPTRPATAPAPADAPAVEHADAKPPAPRAPLTPVGAVRELPDAERQAAVAARDAADLLRADYEKPDRLARAKGARAAGVDDAAFAGVVRAYRRAIDQFPGSEVECYCRLRLAGTYQYRGQFELALDEAKQAAERFTGTGPGLEATQAVALTYLQALHDPVQAADWFEKLQAAAAAVKDDPERLKWQVAAAEGLTRCNAEPRAGKK